MKIMLTGAQGFLGHRVLEMLLERNHQVKALVRRPAPDLEALGAETASGDLGHPASVAKAASGMDGIVHCAARSGVWGPLHNFIKDNFVTTANVLSAARKAGAGWMVHTSSPSVVHTGRPLNGTDESAPYMQNPVYGYPYSKMLAEKFVLSHSENDFQTVALRPHLIWGANDPHFLPRLVKMARLNKLKLPKTEAKVDATYIDNAAWAHVLAAEKLGDGAAIGGRAYFIGQDEPITVYELVSKILTAASGAEQLKASGQFPQWLGHISARLCETVWRAFNRKGEPPLTRFVYEELTLPHWFNLSRARQDLGYAPLVTMAEGLKKLSRSQSVA